MKCLSKWLAERWNKLALSRFSISCSFSKTCLTNINYLQLLAVEKGQGLLGFSICTINWFTDRNDAALERHNSLVRYVASLWLMFSSCPHVHVAVHVFKMFREKPLRGKGSSPLVFFCFVLFVLVIYSIITISSVAMWIKVFFIHFFPEGCLGSFLLFLTVIWCSEEETGLLVTWNGHLTEYMRHYCYLWHFRECNHSYILD